MENNEAISIAESNSTNEDILGDINVELQVKIGKASVSVSELMNIKPGDVVRTGVKIPDEVELTYKSKVIATGRLIDRDGCFAIQIVSMLNG